MLRACPAARSPRPPIVRAASLRRSRSDVGDMHAQGCRSARPGRPPRAAPCSAHTSSTGCLRPCGPARRGPPGHRALRQLPATIPAVPSPTTSRSQNGAVRSRAARRRPTRPGRTRSLWWQPCQGGCRFHQNAAGVESHLRTGGFRTRRTSARRPGTGGSDEHRHNDPGGCRRRRLRGRGKDLARAYRGLMTAVEFPRRRRRRQRPL